jgi:hypothetical protein
VNGASAGLGAATATALSAPVPIVDDGVAMTVVVVPERKRDVRVHLRRHRETACRTSSSAT